MITYKLLFPVGLLIMSGCSDSETKEDVIDNAVVEVDCPSIAYSSNIDSKLEVIIEDESNYSYYFENANSSREGKAPSVDFSNNMVILIHSGKKTSAGYKVEIKDVKDNNGKLDIHYVTTTPPNNDPSCAQDTVITYPYCMISTNIHSAQDVNFIETISETCI